MRNLKSLTQLSNLSVLMYTHLQKHTHMHQFHIVKPVHHAVCVRGGSEQVSEMGKEGQPAVMEVSAQGDERETTTHTLSHTHWHTSLHRVESRSRSLTRHSLRLPGLWGSHGEEKTLLPSSLDTHRCRPSLSPLLPPSFLDFLP